MIAFSASTAQDLPQLEEWIAADPYHKHQGQPNWWLTGNGLLAFCLTDGKGPLTFVRLDEEGEYVRIHTQFAPEAEVSKRRLVIGMMECMAELAKLYGGRKGFIFKSVSPTLIVFMKKYYAFEAVGDDDYRVDFEGNK